MLLLIILLKILFVVAATVLFMLSLYLLDKEGDL